MKRSFRYALLVLATIVVLLGVIVVRGLLHLDMYYEAKAALAHTAALRAWRCHGVTRPSLVGSRADWKLEYSWVGGFGHGDVWLELGRDGRASLKALNRLARSESRVERVLSPAQVGSIAAAIDDSALLCLDPGPRRGYFVLDLGRFSFKVSAPGYMKTVYIDECTTVADTLAVGEVIRAIYALKGELGEAVAWGPGGTFSASGECPVDR